MPAQSPPSKAPSAGSERRGIDAREQLRTAHDMRELLATGETARERTVETSDELTAQEAQARSRQIEIKA